MAGSPQKRQKRIKINLIVEAEILELSRRRCCLCYGLKRDLEIKNGQIAHLNHNPSDNRQSNLAYLCLEHHDQYDGRTRLSKNITRHEVVIYRAELYKDIKDKWKISRKPLKKLGVRNISGHYVREGINSSAELDVYLFGEKISVRGFALRGKNNPGGPNIGTIDFDADLVKSTAEYILENKKYRLFLKFGKNRLVAEETHSPGLFGLGVTFLGTYVKK